MTVAGELMGNPPIVRYNYKIQFKISSVKTFQYLYLLKFSKIYILIHLRRLDCSGKNKT